MLTKLLWLALAGAFGTLARFGLSEAVKGLIGRLGFAMGLPFGTWAVNITGCFLFGLVLEYFEGRHFLRPDLSFILLVGFMGAFTTFSTYIFESAAFVRNGETGLLLLNLLGQNLLGFLALFAGLWLGRLIP